MDSETTNTTDVEKAIELHNTNSNEKEVIMEYLSNDNTEENPIDGENDTSNLPSENISVQKEIWLPPWEAVQKWVAQVSQSSEDTVEAIIKNAKVVFDAEMELGLKYGKAEIDLFRKNTCLSQSMLSKMKRVGEKANLFLTHKATLPASLTTLYGLTTLSDKQLTKRLESDLRGVTRIMLEKRGDGENGIKSLMHPLISFKISADVSEDKMIQIIDDIKDAVKSLSDSYKVPIEVSAVAWDREKLEKSQLREIERDGVRKGREIFERLRKKFREERNALKHQGITSRAEIDEKFKQKFNAPYRDVIQAEDPYEIYDSVYGPIDWISNEDLVHYKAYVGDFLASAPFQSRTFTHSVESNDEILEEGFLNRDLVLKRMEIKKVDSDRFAGFS